MHELALDYFTHVKKRHASRKHATDFFTLARAFGIQILPGKHNAYFPHPEPTITLQYGIYCARYGQRVGMHEIAHHLLQESGLENELLRLHEDWPGAEETIEQLCAIGATLLMLPDPLLRAARRKHGDTADALLHLYARGDANFATVMRRWVYAEPDACRAAWTTTGNYVSDVAALNLNLPFWRYSRVPELPLTFPQASYQALSGTRTLGVVGW